MPFPLLFSLCRKTVLHRAFPQPRAFVTDQRKGEEKGEGKGTGEGKFEGNGKGKGLDARQVRRFSGLARSVLDRSFGRFLLVSYMGNRNTMLTADTTFGGLHYPRGRGKTERQ